MSTRSNQRRTRPVTGACLLSLALLLCPPVWTQVVPSSLVPTASQPEAPKDILGRTTPRGAVFGFVNAARKGDYELAAQYLNTERRGKPAADLARQLFVVLDRRLPPRLNTLSDQPEGSLSNPLKPEELVGTIDSEKGPVDIDVERVDQGKSGLLWMFSRETLNSIPDLYQEVNVVSAENILPGFLVNTRFAGIVLFEWLAVFVGMPLFYLLASMLSSVSSPLIGQWRRRLYRKESLPNPQVLPRPVRILLLALFIRWLLTQLNLPLLARQFWFSTTSILTIAGCVWLLILLNGRIEEYIRRRLQIRNLTGTTSVLRLARRTIDGLLLFAGVLVTMYFFGLKPTAALAGLGVGGIAIAFAAQKTLENVIGGVSLILDRAVRVGDTLKVGETVGTVDDVGLRSTRIRTLDRTVVSVPNGQIANLSIENLSARDKFWLHHILTLRYGATSGQMHAVLSGIRSLLGETRLVESASARVRFLGFGQAALNVEVFAYILARDWDHFLEIQEGLLFRTIECVESAGLQIAPPSQVIFMPGSSSSTDARVDESLKGHEPDK